MYKLGHAKRQKSGLAVKYLKDKCDPSPARRLMASKQSAGSGRGTLAIYPHPPASNRM